MVLPWSLSDIKSPQVSRACLRILAVLSNAVVWIVSTRPPISKSSTPFNNPLVIVPNPPITFGTIVTFMFYCFFNSLARSRYLSFFSLSFRFILWSAGIAKSPILQIFFFLLLIIMRSGLLAGIKWSVCIWLLLLLLLLLLLAIADSFSLKSEWQKVSSSLQDSSKYSGSSQKCCSLDGLHSSANLQVL